MLAKAPKRKRSLEYLAASGALKVHSRRHRKRCAGTPCRSAPVSCGVLRQAGTDGTTVFDARDAVDKVMQTAQGSLR